MRKFTTKELAMGGILIAIQVVLSRVLSIMLTPEIKLSFGGVPIALAGLLFGPLLGGAVGLGSDLVGILINLSGPKPHPGFMLTATLAGVIPGIFKMIFINENRDQPLLATVCSFVLVLVVLHLGLNTLWLSQLFGTPYFIAIQPRLITSTISDIANYLVTYLIYRTIRPTVERNFYN